MNAPSHTTDQETRQRLLQAAAQLFAERGFESVTVRDVCTQAGTNVASVNYYFRDKWGLYKELVLLMVERMRSTYDLAHGSGEGKPPEERLRIYIRVLVQGMWGEGRPTWQSKLVAREMADPTPALDLVVEHVIRPNSLRLGRLVSELLGCPVRDERVGRCIGSIQSQCVTAVYNPIVARLVPGLELNAEYIEKMVEHIAEFSVAGIRAIASQTRGVMR